jgi:hypothetical protein
MILAQTKLLNIQRVLMFYKKNSEKCLFLKGTELDVNKNVRSSCTLPVILVSLLMKLKFSRQSEDKEPKMEFYCLNMLRAPTCPSSGVQLLTSAFRWPYLESRLGCVALGC